MRDIALVIPKIIARGSISPLLYAPLRLSSSTTGILLENATVMQKRCTIDT